MSGSFTVFDRNGSKLNALLSCAILDTIIIIRDIVICTECNNFLRKFK